MAFKLNSVINTFNVDEDMTESITQLGPVRWKVTSERECAVRLHCGRLDTHKHSPPLNVLQVFQCLLIDGENAGEEALREAERFVISEQQFQEFLDRHSSVSCLVPESNEKVGWSDLSILKQQCVTSEEI